MKLLGLVFLILTLSCTPNKNKITIKYGYDKAGVVSNNWLQFDSEINQIPYANMNKEPKLLTEDERDWENLIKSRIRVWENQLEEISTPYTTINVPEKLTVIIGNRGFMDAFANPSYSSNIYFNVSKFLKSYGSAKELKNKNRIDRFFAHEFTHLLQYRWIKKHPFAIKSHIDQALMHMYKEGIAHYRSISSSWKDENGMITSKGEKTLVSLEKVFVERMIALKTAPHAEAIILMKGLSMGPFNKKWGALTVALWMTKYAKGNDSKLSEWVNLGPKGMLELAKLYLPEELNTKFKNEFK